jgi:hypothetical protein
MRIAVIGTMVLALAGCTWVDLTSQGETVTVVSAVPSSCQRLGSTTSTTRANIASIDRDNKKVSAELATLARNAGAKMGGDTIRAESKISDKGEQTFGVYRCGA